MTFESSVVTRPGTLIINPPVNQAPKQNPEQQPAQEDASQSRSGYPAEIVIKRGDSESFAQADKFREQQGGQFSGGKYGVDAYQSLAVETRREEIKQMMGVDTYA
ncbi:hypothetical protein [Planctobacterium marinum]|uniref:Uncharacterized protein n=1 Tax=Planctobacterium marinum TaxID=1631968 RepID=A0AA48KRF5_9ALTE|nr:hypothetical protein MACH26_15830 [Planctobacterium marinum]